MIEGTKAIYHNMGGIEEPDDATYPLRLSVSLRIPDFMAFTARMIYGPTEEIVILCMDNAALSGVLGAMELRTHPRLRELKIELRDGEKWGPYQIPE